jgi:hypothetical protein
MKTVISEECRAEVIARYTAGDRPKNIAIALGINYWNVSVIVRREGCSRSRVEAQQLILSRREWVGNTRYSLDHSAFSEVTPDSAYWAGFLMADGCVIRNKVRLNIATKDINHLEKFRSFMKANVPILLYDKSCDTKFIKGRPIRGTGSALITIASERVVMDLATFGVIPRKTYTARVSRLGLNRDFWRGMVDGDGSIFLSGRKPYLSLVGAEDIMWQFSHFISTICDTRVTVKPDGNIFKVYMSSGPAREVIRCLYQNATSALSRKAEKASSILSFH